MGDTSLERNEELWVARELQRLYDLVDLEVSNIYPWKIKILEEIHRIKAGVFRWKI